MTAPRSFLVLPFGIGFWYYTRGRKLGRGTTIFRRATVLSGTEVGLTGSPHRFVRGEACLPACGQGSRACRDQASTGPSPPQADKPAGPTERGGPSPLSNSPRGLCAFSWTIVYLSQRRVRCGALDLSEELADQAFDVVARLAEDLADLLRGPFGLRRILQGPVDALDFRREDRAPFLGMAAAVMT